MGCCQSASSGSDDHDPNNRNASRVAAGQAHQANTRSIVAPQVNNSPSRVRSTSAASPISQTNDSSSIARPNKPIRPPSPLPSSPTHIAHQPPPWTRAQLTREREAFFETRISGSPEVWAGLRIVAETLRRVSASVDDIGHHYSNTAREHDEDFDDEHARDKAEANVTETGLITPPEESADALATAQALLDALNLTCPQGRVASGRGRGGTRERGGVYDERGTLYELPAWVVRDPEDLIAGDGGDEREVNSEKSELLNSSTGQFNDPVEKSPRFQDLASPRHQSENKGKGRAEDLGERIAVRVRLSDRARDIVVHIGERQTVADLLRIVCEYVGLTPWPEGSSNPAKVVFEASSTAGSNAASGTYVRLAFLGKMLESRRSLRDSGWRTGQVINAFVF